MKIKIENININITTGAITILFVIYFIGEKI